MAGFPADHNKLLNIIPLLAATYVFVLTLPHEGY
jgi:hypothetical protein